jgi:hypothetical protein
VTEGSSQSVLTTISKQTNQKNEEGSNSNHHQSTFHERRLAKWEYFLREVTEERRNGNLNRVKESTA